LKKRKTLRKSKVTRKVKRKSSRKVVTRRNKPRKLVTRKRPLTFEHRARRYSRSKLSTRPTEARRISRPKGLPSGSFIHPKNVKTVQKHTTAKKRASFKSRLNKGKGLLKTAKRKVDMIAKAVESTGDFAGKYASYVSPELVAGVGAFSPTAGLALGASAKTAGIIADTSKALTKGIEYPIAFARENKKAALTARNMQGFLEGEKFIHEIGKELVQLEHGNYPMLMAP